MGSLSKEVKGIHNLDENDDDDDNDNDAGDVEENDEESDGSAHEDGGGGHYNRNAGDHSTDDGVGYARDPGLSPKA